MKPCGLPTYGHVPAITITGLLVQPLALDPQSPRQLVGVGWGLAFGLKKVARRACRVDDYPIRTASRPSGQKAYGHPTHPLRSLLALTRCESPKVFKSLDLVASYLWFPGG